MLRTQDVTTRSDLLQYRSVARVAVVERSLRDAAESLSLYLLVSLVWGIVLFFAVTQAL